MNIEINELIEHNRSLYKKALEALDKRMAALIDAVAISKNMNVKEVFKVLRGSITKWVNEDEQ